MKTVERQLVIINIEQKDIDQIFSIYSSNITDQCLFSVLLYSDEKKSIGLDLDKRYSFKNREKIYLHMYCSDGAGKIVGSISSKLEPTLSEVRLAEALDQLINTNRQFFDKVSDNFNCEFLIKLTANISSDETVADTNDIDDIFNGD